LSGGFLYRIFKEKRIMNKKTVVSGVVILCVILSQAVMAAEGAGSTSSPQVEGEWEFKSQMPGMSFSATMTITKNDDGKYSGTWSAEFGESKVSDITFENKTLKFVQTSDFGGQEMKTTYEATVEGAKFTGKGKNQFGESIVEATMEGMVKEGAETIAGTWQVSIKVPEREIVDKLTITKNADGTLAGKWTGERGESTISNMKFEGGKLTFTRTGKWGPTEFTTSFEGTVEGDRIKGAFSSDFGEMPINATRVGAAKPAEKKAEAEPNKTK
jgi:hypothetical protein